MTSGAPQHVGGRQRGSKRLLAGIVLAAVAVGVLAYHLVSDYEVLEKGRLLPYTEGQIYKVRFGGWLTLYLEPELRPSLDLLNAYLLTGVAFVALSFMVILAAGGDAHSPRFRFFLLAFVGTSYLVADETLGLHETIGHNLRFLAELPFIDRPDDAVVILLAVPAVLFLAVFRGVLLASRRATILFAAGLASFLASACADALSLPGEEAVEVVATTFLVGGMIALGVHHTRGGVGSP